MYSRVSKKLSHCTCIRGRLICTYYTISILSSSLPVHYTLFYYHFIMKFSHNPCRKFFLSFFILFTSQHMTSHRWGLFACSHVLSLSHHCSAWFFPSIPLENFHFRNKFPKASHSLYTLSNTWRESIMLRCMNEQSAY